MSYLAHKKSAQPNRTQSSYLHTLCSTRQNVLRMTATKAKAKPPQPPMQPHLCHYGHLGFLQDHVVGGEVRRLAERSPPEVLFVRVTQAIYEAELRPPVQVPLRLQDVQVISQRSELGCNQSTSLSA